MDKPKPGKKGYVKGKHLRVDWGHGVKEIRKMKERAPEQKPQAPQLEIEVDDVTAQGVYANFCAITHTQSEFLLDFIFMQPGRPKAKVRTRIISSPHHTKRLVAALADNLGKYEARFGPIATRQPDIKTA
ncbi:MAG: DUF3467 domain-containing protein [Elusimicrobiota bacterium]